LAVFAKAQLRFSGDGARARGDETEALVMIEMMVDWAREPATSWWVLCVAGLVIGAGAIRQSREALWGDMFSDDIDEE